MIKVKVYELLEIYKMSRKRLAELINVLSNTMGNIYHENIKRIDIDVPNKICKVLD